MPFDIPAAIKSVSELLQAGINRIWPDPTEEQKAQVEELKATLAFALSTFQGQVAVIVAEAQGEGFLQRNWRPITMLVFLWLIVSYFYGWYGVNFSEALAIQLFELIKIGLGGYVVGRSVEKVAPSVVKAIAEFKASR